MLALNVALARFSCPSGMLCITAMVSCYLLVLTITPCITRSVLASLVVWLHNAVSSHYPTQPQGWKLAKTGSLAFFRDYGAPRAVRCTPGRSECLHGRSLVPQPRLLVAAAGYAIASMSAEVNHLVFLDAVCKLVHGLSATSRLLAALVP